MSSSHLETTLTSRTAADTLGEQLNAAGLIGMREESRLTCILVSFSLGTVEPQRHWPVRPNFIESTRRVLAVRSKKKGWLTENETSHYRRGEDAMQNNPKSFAYRWQRPIAAFGDIPPLAISPEVMASAGSAFVD